MITNSKNQDIQKRAWFIEIYEESVNPNYVNILKNTGYKIAISPIHNKDVWTADDEKENPEHVGGSYKKPHRHIIILFNGSRKLKDVEPIIESINAYKHCQVINNKQKAYEYLFHKNDTDKYRYAEENIILLNCTKNDFLSMEYVDILNYIDDNNIKTISSLLKQLRKDENYELLKYVSNNTYFVKSYLDELRKEYDNKIIDTQNYLKSFIDKYEFNEVINTNEIKHLLELFESVNILMNE